MFFARAARLLRAPLLQRSPVLASILVLSLLGVGPELEVLCALNGLHALRLALRALELEHNLLRGLRLLVEHGLRLTAEPCLLLVVPPVPLSLASLLPGLVLGDLVRRVLLALLAVR